MFAAIRRASSSALVPSVRECRINARCGSQCRLGFVIAARGSQHMASPQNESYMRACYRLANSVQG
jgi:hypothetical protein